SFFFSSRRRHTRFSRDWSSDVCSSDLQPVVKNDHTLVIMLDLSASMYAQDVRPSRLVKALLKVTDIVRARRDGLTALVVYAADAYKVVPLTDDTRTIESLLPSLSPGMMPAPGSRPEKAIRLAQEMTHS